MFKAGKSSLVNGRKWTESKNRGNLSLATARQYGMTETTGPDGLLRQSIPMKSSYEEDDT
jgi:hypothetical protein